MFIHSLIHPLIISRHYRIIKPHFNVCKKKERKKKKGSEKSLDCRYLTGYVVK